MFCAQPAACSGNPAGVQYGAFDCGNATDSGNNCTAACDLRAGQDGAPTSTCLLGSWGNATGSCLPPRSTDSVTYQTTSVTLRVVVAGSCSAQTTAAVVAGVTQDVTAALNAQESATNVVLNVQPGPCATVVSVLCWLLCKTLAIVLLTRNQK